MIIANRRILESMFQATLDGFLRRLKTVHGNHSVLGARGGILGHRALDEIPFCAEVLLRKLTRNRPICWHHTANLKHIPDHCIVRLAYKECGASRKLKKCCAQAPY